MSKRERQAENRTARLFKTEKTAREILLESDTRCRIPSTAERRALMVSYAERGIALIPTAFDAVRVECDIDLTDSGAISSNLDAVAFVEIKSTNQAKIGTDLEGYFFNITSAELAVAQALGDRHRFAFVNTARAEVQELSLQQVLAKVKAMYPAFHLRL